MCSDFEIYFHDLKEEVQQQLLEAFGMKSPKERNWDVFPIAIIPCSRMDEDEEE